MKKLRSSTKSDPSIPVSGMADIAFLLIIFFMVTTSFMKDKGMPLELPKSEEDKSKKQMKEVTVTVSENQIVLNKDPVEIGELQELLEKALDKQVKKKLKKKKKKTKTAGEDSPATESNRIVILKSVGDDIPYQKWVRVVDIIKLAKGTITILIEEETNDGSSSESGGKGGSEGTASEKAASGSAEETSGKSSEE